MIKIGLKLWSTNAQYVKPARELFERKIFDYVELFTVPGSSASIAVWEKQPWPYVLHAPHSHTGLNPSIAKLLDSNLKLMGEVAQFARALNPLQVIFHPGVDGSATETIAQFQHYRAQEPDLFDKVLVENKPVQGLNNETCVGALPKELETIARESGMGICLDFGHACAAAVSTNTSEEDIIAQFLALSPVMFHISDGHRGNVLDEHLHLGAGDHDLEWMVNQVPENGLVTIETVKDSKETLDDFENDVHRLPDLITCRQKSNSQRDHADAEELRRIEKNNNEC